MWIAVSMGERVHVRKCHGLLHLPTPLTVLFKYLVTAYSQSAVVEETFCAGFQASGSLLITITWLQF